MTYHDLPFPSFLLLYFFFQSAESYQNALQSDPCRTTGMSYYSTVLWHMNDDVRLSYLANEVGKGWLSMSELGHFVNLTC